jgi:hypothetical protein
MTVFFEAGYVLPGPDLPLKHARVAHAGNWHAGGTITASTTETGFVAASADNSLTYERWKATALTATWDNDLGSAKLTDYCCITAHNMGTNGNTLQVQYDSTGGGAWVDVINQPVLDDSPIFAIFLPETRQKWRVQISGGTIPEIGVVKFGTALQFERPFYGGFAPTRMSRRTSTTGNMSEGGEFLGRSKIRSSLATDYKWSNLTYAWVRANLDGPTGLIQSLETEPFFLAWRSSSEADVDFGWTKSAVGPPTLSGTRDLVDFGFQAEVYGYE